MALVLRSFNPWRITALLDSIPNSDPTKYVLSTVDGSSTNITVTNVVFLPTSQSIVDLALSSPLLSGVAYSLFYAVSFGFGTLTYTTPLVTSPVIPIGQEDPEAEIFGVDVDWFADGLTASGDLPTIRGRQCLVNDLIGVSLTQKGEIFHRPDTGAGMVLRTNGPTTDSEVSSIVGALKREYAKDDRVRLNGVLIKADKSTAGVLNISATAQSVAIDEPLTFKLPGGST